MSRSKRNQIKSSKTSTPLTIEYDNESVSEEAAIITALLKGCPPSLTGSGHSANTGFSVMNFPKNILVTMFERLLPNICPGDEGVKEIGQDAADLIKKSKVIVIRLGKEL